MKDTEKFGKRIKAVRKFRGYTLTDVAKKTGLAIGYLSDIENGKRGIGIINLLNISVALEVSTDWLLSRVLCVGDITDVSQLTLNV